MQDILFKTAIKHAKLTALLRLLHWIPRKAVKLIFGNFWHLACKHKSIELMEYAHQGIDSINEIDKKGLAPIHYMIESGFYMESGKMKFSMSMDALKFFLEQSPDINIKFIKPLDARRLFSRTDISGTALELLVVIFWDKILHKSRHDYLEFYDSYEKTFLILCKYGANINLLFEGEDFGKEDIIQDAMQKLNNRIMSHFFIKYISHTNDLYAIRPFLRSPHLDFNLLNETGHNVLHILFRKITNKGSQISHEMTSKIMLDICMNPKFSESALHHKDNFSYTPLQSLKGSAIVYKKIFESYFLQQKLTSSLKIKPEGSKAVKI